MVNEQGTHHADLTSFASSLTKSETLSQLVETYLALSTDQPNWVCNLSNASSLLWHAYHSLNIPVNWAGFYVIDPKSPTDQLILGPFQGKVACQTIRFNRGVCGAAAETKLTQLVPNVEEFPGHIACDGETKSEIVVPILDKNGVLRGVLDIDCLALEGFDETDKEELELLAKSIGETCEW
ncbi:hypothetical protein WICPIJ_006699 [Wickerhamomyces pijperi]|uniref:GAF domain-containing protein n=1 Tax=Wickerhamomyces pijperi TaxID=599730 RepID=A0A9P8Q1U9_WICPI|nr:hypothetical protein WICPIJ_006699 [Wickerhamomyces pijperi]